MAATAEAVLLCEGLGKSRTDEKGGEVTVLRGVDLNLAAGRITVVIGPSGGGKSTLVRLLNRLEEPDGGRVLFNGRDIRDCDPLQLRRRIALLPQQPFVFAGTALSNLQQPFHYQGRKPPAADDPQLQELLVLCKLSADLLPREARTLSLGQKQRLCLARSLTTSPEVLLLDEPTSALDRPTVDGLIASLKAICRQRQLAVLLVTHDLYLAQAIADDLVYLQQGSILEQGAASELFRQPRSAALQRFLLPAAEMEG